MHTRALGPFTVSAIGLGCMSLSHAYGTPPDPAAAATLLRRALDLGYTHVDTAALYGFGANETLIGRTLAARRRDFVLATKGGMFRNAQGQREIDGRPEMIKKNCEESLQRLKTDVIDLYYLHRWDKRLPIEIETTLFRIVQESLTNVVLHAQAKRVDVLLSLRGQHVSAIVEDDGVGFIPTSASFEDQLGLFGMRERVEMLAGTFTIESSPGQGTTVKAEIPFDD